MYKTFWLKFYKEDIKKNLQPSVTRFTLVYGLDITCQTMHGLPTFKSAAENKSRNR